MKVKSESEVAKCLTLHDPMDYSLPGSSVHGIFQARVLEWVAIAFSESKAVAVFNSLKAERSGSCRRKSNRGWLIRFKERSHFHIMKVQDEATSAEWR